jgi:hypothetical protein
MEKPIKNAFLPDFDLNFTCTSFAEIFGMESLSPLGHYSDQKIQKNIFVRPFVSTPSTVRRRHKALEFKKIHTIHSVLALCKKWPKIKKSEGFYAENHQGWLKTDPIL